jgi:hypothetical protein
MPFLSRFLNLQFNHIRVHPAFSWNIIIVKGGLKNIIVACARRGHPQDRFGIIDE